MAGVLAQILDNFVALKGLVNNLNDKTADDIKTSVAELSIEFANLKDKLEVIDSNIDEDLTRQLSIIEHNFESLMTALVNLFARQDANLTTKIEAGFTDISGKMQAGVTEKLEQYKSKLEELFSRVADSNNRQAEFIKERVLELNSALNESLTAQNENTSRALNDIALGLRNILDENLKLTADDYNNFRVRLENFVINVEKANDNLIDVVKKQMNEIVKSTETKFNNFTTDIKEELGENTAKVAISNGELADKVENCISAMEKCGHELSNTVSGQLNEIARLSEAQMDVFSKDLKEKFDDNYSKVITSNNLLLDKVKDYASNLDVNSRHLTDLISGQMDNILGATDTKLNVFTSDLNSKIEENSSRIVADNDIMRQKFEHSLSSVVASNKALVCSDNIR